ncbi:MAG: hypothetical protein LBC99_05665 [Spirochaetota bacterium]|jgi:hypothetical protein|nr:hypothetical protein [Spirochaetota bacterium]
MAESAENEVAVKKSCLQCTECKKLAALLGAALVIGLVAGFFLFHFSSASTSMTPLGLVRQIEAAILRAAPGEDGKVLATIEGEALTRKLFDLQLNLTLQSAQGVSQEQIVQRKNDPAFLKQFLEQVVQSRIILHAMETDPVFKGDPDLLVIMDLLLADGLSRYYLSKKASESTVSTNVSNEEVGQVYNQVRQDPQYAAIIDRLPFDEIKQRLIVDIVRQRQVAVVREQLEKVRGELRIFKYDEIFGATPGNSTNTGTSPLGTQYLTPLGTP